MIQEETIRAETISKILPLGATSAPSKVFSVSCTYKEFKMLILARLRSALEKYSADYFTVDDFVAAMNSVLAPHFHCCSGIGNSLPDLMSELKREGKIAIVPFSPMGAYKIVDKPSPNPQTRS